MSKVHRTTSVFLSVLISSTLSICNAQLIENSISVEAPTQALNQQSNTQSMYINTRIIEPFENSVTSLVNDSSMGKNTSLNNNTLEITAASFSKNNFIKIVLDSCNNIVLELLPEVAEQYSRLGKNMDNSKCIQPKLSKMNEVGIHDLAVIEDQYMKKYNVEVVYKNNFPKK
jgi:hypothetical protein